MVRRIQASAICVALAALGVAPPAHACSCVSPRLSRRALPADGAAGFPTDGTIRVFLRAFDPALRSALASEYRLRDASGALVPMRSDVVETRLDLSPQQPLAPNTRYTLEQVFAYGPSGNRLSDTERLRASGPVRGAWFPAVSFTTGAGPAPNQQRAPTLTSARVGFAHGGGDCGPGISLLAEVEAPPGTDANDVIELQVRGQGAVATEPAEGASRLYAGNMLCNPDPIAIAYSPGMTIRAVLLDAAGRELGATPWTSVARPAGRVPRARSRRGRGLGTGSWSAITIAQPPAAPPARGPTGCRHGFEEIARSEVASQYAPRAYGARSTLATDGRSGWIAFSGGQGAAPMRLVRVDADGSTAVVGVRQAGHPVALAAGPAGPLAVTRTRAPGQGLASRIVAMGPRGGAPRWSHALPHEGDAYRVARGDGRVLVAWGARTPDYRRDLTWAIFDERSGASVGSPTRTRYRIHTGSSEAPAVAYLDDRFLVAWTPEIRFRHGPMKTMVVRADGSAEAPRTIGVDAEGIPDLAAAGARGGLVTSRRGRILWALLERDGTVTAGPTVISSGVGGRDNRVPRIAWDGDVFGVAWETHPQAGVYVAAVDAQGNASPALRLDHGESHAGAVGIAASRDGFFASFTADRGRGVLVGLRCRAGPPPGAPQHIAP